MVQISNHYLETVGGVAETEQYYSNQLAISGSLSKYQVFMGKQITLEDWNIYH